MNSVNETKQYTDLPTFWVMAAEVQKQRKQKQEHAKGKDTKDNEKRNS